jgi:hypothetical protein
MASVLARRTSLVPESSPLRRRSPVTLPKVQRDTSRQRRGQYTFKRRTGSLDVQCTSDIAQTPVFTGVLPFPNAQWRVIEARNAIATPSSTQEDSGLYNITMDESLYSYLSSELAPREASRRANCPTPAPIPSVTPDLDIDDELLKVSVLPLVQPKSPQKPKPKPMAKGKTVRLPRVVTRNTPSPFRAMTRGRRHSPMYDRRNN